MFLDLDWDPRSLVNTIPSTLTTSQRMKLGGQFHGEMVAGDSGLSSEVLLEPLHRCLEGKLLPRSYFGVGQIAPNSKSVHTSISVGS